MNKLFFILLLVFSVNSNAEELKPSDAKLIEDAGIPLYPDAIFATGNQDVGFRFVTDDSPEEVQEWYSKELPKYNLYNKYGSWILYNGEPDKGMAYVMSVNQISIAHNTNLPEWYSLSENMTTEIVIMVAE